MKAIRMRDIKKTIEAKGNDGKPAPFSCRVYTQKGKRMDCEDVVCTSSYHGGTYNIMFANGDIRTIKEHHIVSLNGMEVFV